MKGVICIRFTCKVCGKESNVCSVMIKETFLHEICIINGGIFASD